MKPRIVGREERHQRAISSTPCQDDRPESADDLRLEHLFRHGCDHLGVDVAGATVLTVMFLAAPSNASALVKPHAGLGGGVVRLAHLALAAVDGGDVDDAAEGAGAHAGQ